MRSRISDRFYPISVVLVRGPLPTSKNSWLEAVCAHCGEDMEEYFIATLRHRGDQGTGDFFVCVYCAGQEH